MKKFNYDYSQTMMMKIIVANPDNKGGSKVFNTFDEVLEIIKKTDELTAGAPKIIYLVGWQYLGHDDRYPEFFEVNRFAAGTETAEEAREKLLWLIREAKKYHTVLSLHINFSDAYEESGLWDEYLKNGLIVKNAKGKPRVTGTWNSRKAYQVLFSKEYESGYFKKRADKFLSLLPFDEIKTIHADAFFVNPGKGVSIKKEKEYRRKMIEYFADKGVDITSEFIYRERTFGFRSQWGKSDIIGYIPAIWNLRMTQRDFLKYPVSILAGGRLTKGLQWDMDLEKLFYGNIHGEDLFGKEDWENKFLKEFALINVPYLYLNTFERKKITGLFSNRVAHFSDGVKSYIKDEKITKDAKVLKENGTMCIPAVWIKDTYFAYSDKKCSGTYNIGWDEVEVIPVGDGNFGGRFKTDNGSLTIPFEGGCGYLIKKFEG